METIARPRRFGAKSLEAKLLVEFDVQPLTDFEAARRVAPTYVEGCRRRCSDLRAKGYIEDSGLPRRANPGSKGSRAVVWRITAAGDIALRSLLSTGWDA